MPTEPAPYLLGRQLTFRACIAPGPSSLVKTIRNEPGPPHLFANVVRRASYARGPSPVTDGSKAKGALVGQATTPVVSVKTPSLAVGSLVIIEAVTFNEARPIERAPTEASLRSSRPTVNFPGKATAVPPIATMRLIVATTNAGDGLGILPTLSSRSSSLSVGKQLPISASMSRAGRASRLPATNWP